MTLPRRATRRKRDAPSGDLFSETLVAGGGAEPLAEGATILRGFAEPSARALVDVIAEITAASPFRNMVTPGGYTMSVAMTNCGRLGWVTDRRGYRYDPLDPLSGEPWPALPPIYRDLATRAADAAGYAGFEPDACLVNRYEPGTRLSLHQDRNERDFTAPIVSVSLGLPAVFLFGGARRQDRASRVRLESGDVVVWGGPTRLTFHGVAPLADGEHPLTGRHRINLTLRKAG
jgi:alkylated DNA repair protein (DNA oxidative demethylase)